MKLIRIIAHTIGSQAIKLQKILCICFTRQMALNLKLSNFDISITRHNGDLIFSRLDRIRHVLSGVDLDIDHDCDHEGQGQSQGLKMTLTRDSAHAKCEGVY